MPWRSGIAPRRRAGALPPRDQTSSTRAARPIIRRQIRPAEHPPPSKVPRMGTGESAPAGRPSPAGGSMTRDVGFLPVTRPDLYPPGTVSAASATCAVPPSPRWTRRPPAASPRRRGEGGAPDRAASHRRIPRAAMEGPPRDSANGQQHTHLAMRPPPLFFAQAVHARVVQSRRDASINGRESWGAAEFVMGNAVVPVSFPVDGGSSRNRDAMGITGSCLPGWGLVHETRDGRPRW